MPGGRDPRKLPYDPKSGKRSLIVRVIMAITALGAMASPLANVFEQGFTILGHHVSLGFVPMLLFALGIFNAIPAVMKLTPPSKR